MIAYLSLLIGIVGVLVFVLATNPKLVEIGKCLMYCGLFVFIWQVAGSHPMKIF